MPSKKKKENKNVQKLIIAFSTVALIFAVFFITYYFMYSNSSSQFINDVKTEMVNIDKANKDAYDSVKNLDKIGVNETDKLKEIIKVISASRDEINRSLKTLEKTVPQEKYKNQFDMYLSGVRSNLRAIQLAVNILSNPKSKDIPNALDSLDKYVEEAAKSYGKIKLGKLSVKTSAELDSLSKKIRDFSNAVYSDYASKAALLEQYTNYFDEMDSVIGSFEAEMTDLNNNVALIKNGQTTISNVYSSIENKLMKLTEIKNNYNKIAVPAKTLNQHKTFNDMLDAYSSYCQDFKSAIILYEEAGTDEEALMEVTMEFDELYIRYQEFASRYKDYKNLYNKDKDFYMDINNL